MSEQCDALWEKAYRELEDDILDLRSMSAITFNLAFEADDKKADQVLFAIRKLSEIVDALCEKYEAGWSGRKDAADPTFAAIAKHKAVLAKRTGSPRKVGSAKNHKPRNYRFIRQSCEKRNFNGPN